MPAKIKITLENNEQKLKAGQTLSGIVSTHFSSPKKAQKLMVKIVGIVHTKWTEIGTGSGLAQTFEENEELILGEGKVLWESTEMEKKIPGGERIFPFKIDLGTPSLPSSFEGHHGSVRYRIVAKLERSWKSDVKVEEKINVLSMVDVNSFSDIPATSSNFKKPWYQVLNVGQVEARLELSRRFYCSGENIETIVSIDNHSSSKIQGLTVHIIRMEHYEAQGRSKERKKTLVTLELNDHVKKHTSGFSKKVQVKVPDTVPSMARYNSRLLQISYYAELEINTNTLVSNFKVPVKFTLGSVRRPSSGSFDSKEVSNGLKASQQGLKKSASAPSHKLMDSFEKREKKSGNFSNGPKLPSLAVGNLPPVNPEYFSSPEIQSPKPREDSMGSLPQYQAIDHSQWIQNQMKELQMSECNLNTNYTWLDQNQIMELDFPTLPSSNYADFVSEANAVVQPVQV